MRFVCLQIWPLLSAAGCMLQGTCCNRADAVQVTLSTSELALSHQMLTNAM